MTKEFIPYEEARQLIELGYYTQSVSGYSYPKRILANEILFQQAFRFFRENYKLEGRIERDDDGELYKFRIYYYMSNSKGLVAYGVNKESYEEAELLCLKKLIQLVINEKKSNTLP